MKIFLDTADVEQIRRAHDTGLLDGVTTNPTHVMQTGRKFSDVVEEICKITSGPVSAEAVGATTEELVGEAVKISKIAENVAVKIPMNVEGLRAVPILEHEKDVRTNVTMVFSPTQAYLVMKAGATYASIVLSRLDNVGIESDLLVSDSVAIQQNYDFPTKVLAASLKTQNHILHALRSGADIVTVPGSLFFQMFDHPLTDAGLEQFLKDWESVPR